MSKNRYEIDMCNGTIMDKLISFCIPLMLTNVLQLLFNAVDIIVVGKFAGSSALAAVGSTTALINMIINLFIGVSLGANVISARFFATDMRKEMSETVHTAITFAIVSGIAVMVLGIAITRPALVLMDTPADVIDQSVLYMKIYFCGLPFFMVYNYAASILRAVGDTKHPLYYLIIAGVINACLNLVMVIKFDMGVAGVAIATVASQLISCFLVMRLLCKSTGSYKFEFKKISIRWRYLKEIFKIGIPAGLQSTVINFSNALLQSSVNSFGSDAMAGYTAANNILGFLYVTVNSVTQGCLSFTSQNYAVRKLKRMDRVFIDCLIIQCTLPLALGILSYVFGPQILGIYTDSADVVTYGMEILSITTIPYFLCGIMDMLPGVLRGMGHSTMPMILSVIGTVGTRIIWIYGLFPSHRSLSFLFISYPGSWIFTILMQLCCYIVVRKKVGNLFATIKEAHN
ncbi:MAG: MATE family efflux transporter [Saccharofermentans sp.]|nr:MATE family efflux transporter [Saccharofermentans sp.]